MHDLPPDTCIATDDLSKHQAALWPGPLFKVAFDNAHAWMCLQAVALCTQVTSDMPAGVPVVKVPSILLRICLHNLPFVCEDFVCLLYSEELLLS